MRRQGHSTTITAANGAAKADGELLRGFIRRKWSMGDHLRSDRRATRPAAAGQCATCTQLGYVEP
jgi:hypothetical protein